jgi:hypothetical protein
MIGRNERSGVCGGIQGWKKPDRPQLSTALRILSIGLHRAGKYFTGPSTLVPQKTDDRAIDASARFGKNETTFAEGSVSFSLIRANLTPGSEGQGDILLFQQLGTWDEREWAKTGLIK